MALGFPMKKPNVPGVQCPSQQKAGLPTERILICPVAKEVSVACVEIASSLSDVI